MDAFFARCGIWRAESVADLVRSTELYLADWQPRGRRLAIVSNSGAVCVLGADAAAVHDLELAELAPASVTRLQAVLPTFATTTNPIDVTAGLLTNSGLIGSVLDVLADDAGVDACFVGIPVSGRGYDYPRFARDAAAFAARAGKPVVVATPQEPVAAAFREQGLVVFDEESSAIAALGQVLHHRARMAAARTRPLRGRTGRRPGRTHVLSEAEGLTLLTGAGLPTVPVRICPDASSAAEAAAALLAEPATAAGATGSAESVARVVVKGLPRAATHKSELGLVTTGLTAAEDVAAAAERMLATMDRLGLAHDGVLVAPMVTARHEALVGAHLDPT